MKKPTLIIVGGFAGVGKTTATKRLSQEKSLPLISTDELNDSLRTAMDCDFKTASPVAHELAWAMVKKYLQNNVSVILDTNMCTDRTWKNLDRTKKENPNATILPIILECSLETHKARIDYRGKTNSEHLNLGGDKFEDVLHKYEFIKNLKRPDLIRINADGDAESVHRNILEILK